MRVLVCGGRDFNSSDAVFDALDLLHRKCRISLVIEGGQRGADRWARAWAVIRGVEWQTFEADWGAHGKAAGPRRNRQMLNEGKPDGVVAFPGGRGTADMIGAAEAAGLKVWRPYG